MKLEDVPQDNDPAFEGHTKLCYAVNIQGKIVAATSTGWDVEAAVKDIAWQVIDQDLDDTRKAVDVGQASRLELFMKARQMTPKLLAQNMGLWTWQVQWHLRPSVFRKLPIMLKERYAECLNISPWAFESVSLDMELKWKP